MLQVHFIAHQEGYRAIEHFALTAQFKRSDIDIQVVGDDLGDAVDQPLGVHSLQANYGHELLHFLGDPAGFHHPMGDARLDGNGIGAILSVHFDPISGSDQAKDMVSFDRMATGR